MAPGLLAAPLMAFIGLVLVVPTLWAVRLALSDPTTGAAPSLANLRTIAGDALFWRAIAGNAVLPLATVAVELFAGVALAMLFTQPLPARRWLRAAVVLPFALPEIVFLAVMRAVFAPRGYVNGALAAAGVPAVAWLAPGRALTYATVVLVDAWHTTPIVFLFVLSALAAMPAETLEAARLDGATAWQRFRYVTLPLLRPAIVAAVLLRGVDALRVFATPLVLAGTEGAPVVSTYAYHQWSDYGDDGAAAAAALVLAAVSATLCVPLLRRRREVVG